MLWHGTRAQCWEVATHSLKAVWSIIVAPPRSLIAGMTRHGSLLHKCSLKGEDRGNHASQQLSFWSLGEPHDKDPHAVFAP